jgi:hypothetical protein
MKLYDDVVLSSWVERGNVETVVLRTKSNPFDENVGALNQSELTEFDVNLPEMKGKKRVNVEGKENDTPLIEDRQEKRRKLIHE